MEENKNPNDVVDTTDAVSNPEDWFRDSEFESKDETGDDSQPQTDDTPSEENTDNGTEPATQQIQESETTKAVKPPVRSALESELQYNSRVELFNKNQELKDAESDEEKSLIRSEIKGIRQSLAENSGDSKSPKDTEKIQEQQVFETEDDEEVVNQFLKKKGYLTKDDVQDLVKSAQTLAKQEIEIEQNIKSQNNSINEFYSKVRPDLYNDKPTRELLEKLVIEKYKPTPSTTGEELKLYMDMTAAYFFPKTQSNSNHEKVTTTNISGSQSSNTPTGGKGLDPDLESDLAAKGYKFKGWTV